MVSRILTGVLVFVLVMASDALFTVYIQSAARNQKMLASTTSSLVILLGGVIIWIYVHDPWMLSAETIGGFCGTWLIMTYRERQKLRKEKEEHASGHGQHRDSSHKRS